MITKITFDDAQKLYSSYNPLMTNFCLYNNLSSVLGEKIDNNIILANPRKIYNDILLKHYPNETTIKSSFINKNLLNKGKHVTIFELNVGSSRADLCKINGISNAYEIKTDLDNLLRLDKQLKDYLTVFEKVFVICSRYKVEKIIKLIPEECGIYTYYQNRFGNFSFTLEKDAQYTNKISSNKQLEILTKQELSRTFNLSSTLSKEDMITHIIKNFSSPIINKYFKQLLKMKYQPQWDFIKSNYNQIYDIDYQWFFKNSIEPGLIYQ